MQRSIILGTVAVLAVLTTPPSHADEDHIKEVETWRADRLSSLTDEDGWLTLIGLHWLSDGPQSLGSDPTSDVLLPEGKAPLTAGTLTVVDGGVRLESAEGSGMAIDGAAFDSALLLPDTAGTPSVVSLGDLRFHIIERDGKMGVRLKDRSSPAREEFAGIDYYPIDPDWKVEARFEPHEPETTLPIPTVLGTVSEAESPGSVVFEHDGKEARVAALAAGDDQLWLIFGDSTNGTETYGGGRYLYTSVPDESGIVQVDFNRAYNPPCAFTAYATCPLPPRQNRLDLPVTAGERSYAGPH